MEREEKQNLRGKAEELTQRVGGKGGSGGGGWGEDRHGILLRDTLMLSRLLIKALICLAEGRKAGICGDIISRLKAMPSWS